MPHYDLQSIQKDHNGNKRNHFLFFVLSLVLIGKPWYKLCELFYMYVLVCIYDITLFYHVSLLICDTEINQSIN